MEVTAIRNPADLPWGHVDIVLECTGIFTSKEKCQAHLENGSSRVLISAPGAGTDKTIVYGVNHDTLTADDIVVPDAPSVTSGGLIVRRRRLRSRRSQGSSRGSILRRSPCRRS